MPYSKEVINHYENPRNVGKFALEDEYVGTGMVGAPACGDVMRLQVKIDPKTGIIEDARFQAFGCMSAIAASSYATQKMKGLKIDKALQKITNRSIASSLSLPPAKFHCSVLAEEAIRRALKDYEERYGVVVVTEVPNANDDYSMVNECATEN